MSPFGPRDAFVVAFFVVAYGALAPWTAAGRGPADGLLGQLAYLAFYATAAALLFVKVVRRRRLGPPSWALVLPIAYVALAFASILWSDLPGLSLRRAAALAGAMTLAVWLAGVWGPRRVFRAVAWALAAIAAASWLLLAVAPEVAVHGAGSQHAGDWRGALLHKNLLGREMAFGAALAVILAFAARGPARWGWISAAAAMLVLVVGSGSATGLALALVLAAVVGFTRIPAVGARERFGRWTIAVAVAATGAALVVGAGPALLAALGRDTTFTGRDRIWALTLEQVRAAPLGAGYGAFWDGPAGASIGRSLGYAIGHAHNGWLETAAHLGWPGLTLVVLLVAAVAGVALRSPRRLDDPARAGTLLLLAYAATVNVADAVVTGPNSPTLILLVVALLHAAPSGSAGLDA